MADWLGIDHLLDLDRTEAIWGFFTPWILYAVFFLAHVVVPGRRVPGYVANRDTGEPRTYRLNGLVVFLLAQIVWWLQLTGLPRDWFYRSTIYAVVGGTVLALMLNTVAVFTQPKGEVKNPFMAWWFGRAQEIQLFDSRFDFKMYINIVGATMLSLNALSAAAWNYDRFGDDANPGVYLFAAFFTFYALDFFIHERVHLYTYDLIHENVGLKLIWGGLVVFGWGFVLPLWGMAAHPDPEFSTGWRYFWLIGTSLLFLVGWGIGRGANLQKYTFKRWPDRKFLGIIEPQYISAGERKILCSGFWRPARHFNYLGETLLGLSTALAFGHFTHLWAWVYAIFVTSLVIQRQMDDERQCIEKYGADKWAEYKERVRYRIVPGIY